MMIRKIKNKLLYSYTGMLAGALCVFLALQILSWITGNGILTPRRILQLFVCLSGALSIFLAVSGITLIRHEGFRPKNLFGVAAGIAWAAGNLFCLFLEGWDRGTFLSVPAVLGQTETSPLSQPSGLYFFLTFLILLGCCLDFFLAGMILSGIVAAKHMPAYDKDFAVILGCSISKKGGLLPLLKGRTNRAIRFAWDQERASGKPVCYVPSGGQGPDEVISEGSAMEFYLLTHGAEQYEILPEKASANTYENMVFSKKIIDARNEKANVCFVTTNYHVLRSGILARKAGLHAEGLASSTKWYFWPNGFAREMAAILSMYPMQHLAAVCICLAAAWISTIR